MIYAVPGAPLDAVAEGFPSGLVGTIGVRILDNAGGTHTPRTTDGIREFPAGSGRYEKADLRAPDVEGVFSVYWDDGGVRNGSEQLLVTHAEPAERVRPSSTFEAFAEGFRTGLVGTIGVQILDNAGSVHTARRTTGIREFPAGSGRYETSELSSPAEEGTYSVYWDDGSGANATQTLLVAAAAAVGGLDRPRAIERAYLDEVAKIEGIRDARDYDSERIPKQPGVSLEFVDFEDVDEQTGPATSVTWVWRVRLFLSLPKLKQGSDYRAAQEELKDLLPELFRVVRRNPSLDGTCERTSLVSAAADPEHRDDEGYVVKHLFLRAQTEET